jgi:DNA-binding NarL/FixJ family response regulator
MIRVAIVDDQHAVRLGLNVALQSEPGLVPVGTATDAAELATLLYRTRPDIVLLDYNLPDADGLTVCHEIKSQALAPGVVVYSAFADHSMTVPAIVAGADGILDKGLPSRHLFEAIREVSRGATALPPISNAHLQVAAAALQDQDLPISAC